MVDVNPKIHRHIVVNLVNVFVPHGIGVEIGVKKAKTSSAILNKTTTQHMFLIDPWHNRGREYSRVAKSIREKFPGKTTIIRKKSSDAVREVLDELDFVWIDGNHDYNSVTEDLTLWAPKLCSGGLVVGHDWEEKFPDVERAVIDYAKSKPFAPIATDYEDLEHCHYSTPEDNPVVNISEHGNVWWAFKA